MSYKSEFLIDVQARKSGGAFPALQQEMRQTANTGASAGGILDSAWVKAGLAVAGVGAAVAALSRAWDFAAIGEKAHNTDVAFQALYKNGAQALDALNKGLKGTVDVTNMQVMLNRLKGLGVTLTDITRLSDSAVKVAAANNISVMEALEAMARGVATGSTEALAAMGVVVDQTEAVRKYADELGVSEKALDSNTRRQAVMAEVLSKVQEQFGAIDTSKLQLEMAQLKKQYDDFVSDSQVAASHAVKNTIETGEALVRIFGPLMGIQVRSRTESAALAAASEAEARAAGEKIDRLEALDKVYAKSAARVRERLYLFDAEGKVLADRLQVESDYRQALIELAKLDDARANRIGGLSAAEKERLEILQLTTGDYARGNQQVAKAVAFDTELTKIIQEQAPSMRELAGAYNEARAIMAKYNEEQDPKKLEEYQGRIAELRPVLRGLSSVVDETGRSWSDFADNLTTAQAALGTMVANAKASQQAVDAAQKQAAAAAATWAAIGDLVKEQDKVARVQALATQARGGDKGAAEQLRIEIGMAAVAAGQLSAQAVGNEIAFKGSADAMDDFQYRLDALMVGTEKQTKATKAARQETVSMSQAEFELRAALAQTAEGIESDALRYLADIQQLNDEWNSGQLTDLNEARLRELDITRTYQDSVTSYTTEHLESLAATRAKFLESDNELTAAVAEFRMSALSAEQEAERAQFEALIEHSDAAYSHLSDTFSKLGSEGWEFANQLAEASNYAAEATRMFAMAANQEGAAWRSSMGSAVGASAKATAAFVKDKKVRYFISGLGEAAEAIGSAASYDYFGAGMHTLAAGAFFYAAGKSGSSAGASSKGASTSAARPAALSDSAMQSSPMQNVTINMRGFAVGSDAELGKHLGNALNSAAGSVRLDKRLQGTAVMGY